MRLGTTVTSFRSPHRTFYLGSTWLYEAWCTVGGHEPSLLALLAYQDSPNISANEMLRQKLKTVLLTALLTGAFPLSSHPPAPRRHTTCDSKGSMNSTRQDDRKGSAVAQAYQVSTRRSLMVTPCTSPKHEPSQRPCRLLDSGSGSPCDSKGSRNNGRPRAANRRK